MESLILTQMSVHLFVLLFVCLPVCLPICLSIRLPVCILTPACHSAYRSVYLPVSLCLCVCVCPYACCCVSLYSPFMVISGSLFTRGVFTSPLLWLASLAGWLARSVSLTLECFSWSVPLFLCLCVLICSCL